MLKLYSIVLIWRKKDDLCKHVLYLNCAALELELTEYLSDAHCDGL